MTGTYFSLGKTQEERVEVEVQGYERAVSGDYHDDNWLTAEVRIRAGRFRGKVDAAILTVELQGFLVQLRTLHETLRGVAKFETLEEQLQLTLNGDGLGHIDVTGEVADEPGIGNRLLFKLHLDQSQLGASIRELESVTSRFPIRAA